MKTEKSANRGLVDKRLQRWALPLLALLVAFAAVMALFLMNRESKVVLTESIYQYALGQKTNYSAGVALMPGKYNLIIREEDQQTDGDPTPLYTSESKAMYLPSDFSWVEPDSGYEWRIPSLSRLEVAGDDYVRCVVNDREIWLGGGVLSDCAGTFVFLEKVKLFVNDRTYELPPFSFYSNRGGRIRIYNYDGDELYSTEYYSGDIMARASRGYRIDLIAGIYTAASGRYRLLTASSDLLPSIESY